MDRSQRVGDRHDAGDHRQHDGVDGLRQEQAGDPFDVVDDVPALANHRRHCRKFESINTSCAYATVASLPDAIAIRSWRPSMRAHR